MADLDPEVEAMQKIKDILEALPADDDDAVVRVLRWACRRFGVWDG